MTPQDVVAVVMLPPGADISDATRAAVAEFSDVLAVPLPGDALTAPLTRLLPSSVKRTGVRTLIMVDGEVLTNLQAAAPGPTGRAVEVPCSRAATLPIDILSPTSLRTTGPSLGPDETWWSITSCGGHAGLDVWKVAPPGFARHRSAPWNAWLWEQAESLQASLVHAPDEDVEIKLASILLALGEHDAALTTLLGELKGIRPASLTATRARLAFAAALAADRREHLVPALHAWRPHACSSCRATLLPFWTGVTADLLEEPSWGVDAWTVASGNGLPGEPGFFDTWYPALRRDVLTRDLASRADEARQWNAAPSLPLGQRLESFDAWRRAGLSAADLLRTSAAAQPHALELALGSIAVRDPQWWLGLVAGLRETGLLSAAHARPAAALAAQLDLSTALHWSAQLQPLLTGQESVLALRSAAPDLPVADRVLAAIILQRQDPELARARLVTVASALLEHEVRSCLELVGEIAPEGLLPLIEAFSSTRSRALAMADTLRSLGAHELSAAVRDSVGSPGSPSHP